MRREWTVCSATCLAWILLCAVAAAADASYVHAFTGFTFPSKVADFTRARVTPYNAEKSDIQVDYINHPFSCLISSYVYPAAGALKDHYEKCKAEVMMVHPGAKLIRETPVHFDKSGAGYDGLEALYTMNEPFGGSQTPLPLLSRLILFRYGDYWVFYRITYPEMTAQDTRKQIEAFLNAFQWPAAAAARP